MTIQRSLRAPLTVLFLISAAAISACGDPETKARNYTASGDAYVSRQQFLEAVIEYRRALAETRRLPACTTSWGAHITRPATW
jgi:hypothetical protein